MIAISMIDSESYMSIYFYIYLYPPAIQSTARPSTLFIPSFTITSLFVKSRLIREIELALVSTQYI